MELPNMIVTVYAICFIGGIALWYWMNRDQQSTGSGSNALARRTRRIDSLRHIRQVGYSLIRPPQQTRVSLLFPGLLISSYSQFAVYNIFQTNLQKDQDPNFILLIFILIIKRETFPDLKKESICIVQIAVILTRNLTRERN